MAATVVKLILVLTLHTTLISANNSLYCNYHGSCLCPEDILAFVCRVSAGAATIWRGSFFNCPSTRNEILLRHSQFENGVVGSCNDEEVVAYSTEVTHNRYSSQLNVTISPEMHNGTVECDSVQHEPDIHVIAVGACTLILATGKHTYYCHAAYYLVPTE